MDIEMTQLLDQRDYTRQDSGKQPMNDEFHNLIRPESARDERPEEQKLEQQDQKPLSEDSSRSVLADGAAEVSSADGELKPDTVPANDLFGRGTDPAELKSVSEIRADEEPLGASRLDQRTIDNSFQVADQNSDLKMSEVKISSQQSADQLYGSSQVRQTSGFGLFATGAFDRWYESSVFAGVNPAIQPGAFVPSDPTLSAQGRNPSVNSLQTGPDATARTPLFSATRGSQLESSSRAREQEVTSLASSKVANEKIEKRKMSLVKQEDDSLKLVVRDYETNPEKLKELIYQMKTINPRISEVILNGTEIQLTESKGDNHAG